MPTPEKFSAGSHRSPQRSGPSAVEDLGIAPAAEASFATPRNRKPDGDGILIENEECSPCEPDCDVIRMGASPRSAEKCKPERDAIPMEVAPCLAAEPELDVILEEAAPRFAKVLSPGEPERDVIFNEVAPRFVEVAELPPEAPCDAGSSSSDSDSSQRFWRLPTTWREDTRNLLKQHFNPP